MSAIVGFVLIVVACIASGTYLVATEHYGWAWIPFLLCGCFRVTDAK
jgi:hypothetical protein